MRRALVALWITASAALVVEAGDAPTPALAHGIEDQLLASQPGCPSAGLPASAPATTALRQEFVPALTALDGVDVCLTGGTGTSVVNVKIREGTAALPGDIVASGSVSATPGTRWVHFELTDPIATPPGTTYVIELTGFPVYWWRGTCGQTAVPDCPSAQPDDYAPGVSNSGPAIGDFGFRTYDPGDTDTDGMPDGYELLHDACLDRLTADAGGDPDVDGLTSGQEHMLGTQPCTAEPNTDGDSCSDYEENRPSPNQGGDRDYLSPWDFYDVPVPAGPATGADGKRIIMPGSSRDKAVSLQDVGVVLVYVGRTSSNPAYSDDNNADGTPDGQQMDRAPSVTPGKLWRSGAPTGAISLEDVGAALAQVGHSCVPAP